MADVDEPDLSDLSVAAHLMQNQLAAISMAAAMLQRPEFCDPGHLAVLGGIVDEGSKRLHAAIGLLERGLPGVALAELDEHTLARGGTETPRPYPVPDDDEARVAALRRYQLLDRAPMQELEVITRLAATLVGASGAVINLIDAERQWPAAAWGLDRVEVPRHDAMCNATVATGEPVAVPDASADAVYALSPWVTGLLGNVRLYVSIPLICEGTHAVGTLCVVDDRPMHLPPATLQGLSDLAGLATSVMEGRLAVLELRDLLGLGS
jgi:GAF domain-containing protein